MNTRTSSAALLRLSFAAVQIARTAQKTRTIRAKYAHAYDLCCVFGYSERTDRSTLYVLKPIHT